jgi:hypothetical protein
MANDITKAFYDQQGELVVFVLWAKVNRNNFVFVRVNTLWSNECHNTIMDYIRVSNGQYSKETKAMEQRWQNPDKLMEVLDLNGCIRWLTEQEEWDPTEWDVE